MDAVTTTRMIAEPSKAIAQQLDQQSFGLTDAGKVRPRNEDHFLIAELTKAMHIELTSLPQAPVQFARERGRLLLVADGMGGHKGGEEASALAIATIEQFALNTLKWFFPLKGPDTQAVADELQTALKQADAKVVEEGAQHPELEGMGATLTMAYCLESEVFIVHVGDSRAYLYRDDELQQITRDHTLVAELVERGQIRPHEANGHRMRHVITNVIGGSETGVRVEVHRLDVKHGDRILLCTDGLTEMIPDDRIRAILAAHVDPEQGCKRLVAEANEGGGRDNITVVLANFARTN